MNKIFKVIWNHATQSWTVVSELSKAHKKQSSVKQVAKLSVLAASFVTASGAMAATAADGLIQINSTGTATVHATLAADGIAIGKDSSVSRGANSIAMGNGATVKQSEQSGNPGDALTVTNSPSDSVAIGTNATVTAKETVVIGANATSIRQDTDFGSAENAVVIGSNANSNYRKTVAIGNNAKANFSDAVAIGNGAVASKVGNNYASTAVGALSVATGDAASAFGSIAKAEGPNSTALGREATSAGRDSVAVGYKAVASKDHALAQGAEAKATDTYTIALGRKAEATSGSAISIGSGMNPTIASAGGAIAIGNNAEAASRVSVALGFGAKAKNSQYATAIGSESAASAQFAFAAGPKSIANIQDGVALGSDSKTTVNKGVSGFNQNTTTRNNRSVLNTYDSLTGNKLTSTKAGVSVGSDTHTRQINHLAAGTADDDAVNVAQLKSVNLQIAGDTTETTGADVRLWDQGLTVKGEDKDFISTKAKGNTITISTKKADVTVVNGKAVAPTTKNEGVVTGSELASTVNNLYWTATADTGNAAKVHAGANVKFESADPTKLTIKQIGTDDNAKIVFTPKSTATLHVNQELKEIKAGENITIDPDATDNKKLTIGLSPDIKVDSVTAGDTHLSNGKLTGLDSHIAEPTETVTTTPESLNANAKNEAATVEDVLNAGWNLQANDENVDAVTHADTVNFTSKDKSVVITPNTDGKKTTLDFSVKAADSTLTVGADGVKVNTGSLVNASTAEDDANRGKVTVNAGDENKVATVKNVADAINSAAWTVKVADSQEAIETSTADDEGTSVSAGTTVTHTAGKNLKVKRDGNNVTYALANDVSVNTVTTEKATVGKGDAATTISTSKAGDNVTEVKFGDNAGKPVRVTNVANGVKEGDAVNVRQLNDAKANINQNTQAIGKLNDKIDQVEKRGRKGTAIAGAIGMLPQPHTSGKSMVGVATTNYRGEQAVAVGYSRLSDNGKHIIKLSGSSNVSGKKDAMVGAAYGFQW